MEVKQFKHEGVNENGVCESGGAVNTDGGIRLIKGSCDLEGCTCSEGYIMVISKPLKNGVVEGLSISFDSLEELEQSSIIRN